MKAFAAAAVLAFGVALGAQEPVYTAKDDVTKPVVVSEKKPSYTKAAMEKKIQGAVSLSAVINKDGKPTDIKVVKSLDKEHGLDENAVAALHAWTFKPATKDGKPVLFQVTVEMTFTLRSDK